MTISKSWFSYLTRAFALSLCTALLLSFVSCSFSTTSQEPKDVNTTYTVKHLLQNFADENYTEDSSEQKSGTPGTQTAAAAKSYEGFTAKPFAQATIQADGSTVVEIKYDRNTYTLSYSSEYGDAPASKPVKYGYVLTVGDLPVLSKTGYNFNGWVYENTSIEAGYIVKKDITITALWDEIIASYTVKHLLQNLADDSYTEDEEAAEPKSGKSGTQTAASAKTYEGFTAKTFAQKTIQADGSTVVEIYYDRNTYTVSYSSEYGDAPASKPVKYEYVLTAEDLPVLPDTVLSFNGWRLDGASIEAGYTVKTNITLTAQWKAPPSVTKENSSAVIAALTEDSTIVVTGELSDSDLETLKNAIWNSTYNVNLDLSQTTGLTSIQENVFFNCTKLSGITISDSVTSISNYTFYRCTSLSSVTIPDSVTSIGDTAFGGCTSLTTITVDSNNANYSSVDGVLYNKDATAIIKYPAGKQSATYTIPDSVTSIGNYAFDDCTSLSSVTIPDSVTSIGQYAFRNCSSLSSVTIGDSVTSIGGSAFYDCTFLSSVTIPDSVTSIGNHAFRNCTSLSSVTIPNSITSIGYYAFSGCSKLTSISFIDTTTWYRTNNSINWYNKTDGTLTDVSYPTQNAAYFTSTYDDYFWYKL